MIRLHDVEICVRLDAKFLKNLVEHFSVLAGDNLDRLDARIGLQSLDDGGEFDSLRPSAEDTHDFDFFHGETYRVE